jgi:CheY-like chemotaxis protein
MDEPASHLPILAVTACALPEDVKTCLGAGMDRHIGKPLELRTLLSAIARVLDQARVAA